MNNLKYLSNWLDKHVDKEHYLFSPSDLRALFPDLSKAAYKALLYRSAKANDLIRICRGIYSYKDKVPRTGLVLFAIAAKFRASEFNYISLETVLSDAGVISQIPINRIFIMSSGRSGIINCGKYGYIEYVHTEKKPTEVMDQLFYDRECHLWRATVRLALKDMKSTRRNDDLIDWDIANEFI